MLQSSKVTQRETNYAESTFQPFVEAPLPLPTPDLGIDELLTIKMIGFA
jgi:hypothetical protein